METNKKNTTLMLLSIFAFAVIMSGFFISTHAADATGTEDTDTGTATFGNFGGMGGMGFGGHGPRGGHCGSGGFYPVQVSSEFEQTVTDIANNDTDVQNLLAEGYNVTAVRPIISNVVDAEGNVATRATTAIVMMQKDTSGAASVLVDLEQGKVTQITIMTRTVIDKT